MDYLPRWFEIREKFRAVAPSVVAPFVPDRLEPIFAEIDRHLTDDNDAELTSLESRLKDVLHEQGPLFDEIVHHTTDETLLAAMTKVQEDVWHLCDEFAHFVMQRHLHLETDDDHPFHPALDVDAPPAE